MNKFLKGLMEAKNEKYQVAVNYNLFKNEYRFETCVLKKYSSAANGFESK